jgi:hypothetical protein
MEIYQNYLQFLCCLFSLNLYQIQSVCVLEIIVGLKQILSKELN